MGSATSEQTDPAERWIDYVPLDDLEGAPVNPKDHDEEAIDGSMGRLGVIDVIVLDERTQQIVSGHGRRDSFRRARDAGATPPNGVVVADDGTWTVPVVRGWASTDDAERDAALIAVNRAGERGGWKNDQLAEMLGELSTRDDLMGIVGFDNDDLDDLLASLTEGDPEPEAYDPDVREPGVGAHPESSLGDWADNYRNKQVRSMVFDYPLDAYAEVVAMAAKARTSYEVGSNAELFQAMLTAWTQTQPPAG